MIFNEILEKSGLNQSDFSRKFNIPLRTIQNWAGNRATSPNYVLELLNFAIEAEKKGFIYNKNSLF